jgi:propanol-preferring alcohol dehydrogenase
LKAMVVHKCLPIEEGPLLLEEVDTPEPAAKQILIRVKACGVCRTDLHTVEGDLQLPRLPLIPGHQVVGTVEGMGPGAERFRVGDRVGMAWLHSACGECQYCREGRENLCSHAIFTGFHANGGYAQYAAIGEQFAYPIPEIFSNQEAAPLLCGGIIGYRALRLSEVKPGQRLGLYGFGASAHVAIQVARHWGCDIYVFTRSAEHRELAKSLGANWTGSTHDDPPQPLHSAIIFAPAGELVPEALRVLRPGGTLALAGITMTPIPRMDYDTLLFNERMLRSVTASTRRDGLELLELAAQIPIRTSTTLYPLEKANEVLKMLKESRIQGTAVLEIP